MKQKKFKKIVEWTDYDWQTRTLDMGNVITFLWGIAFGMMFFASKMLTFFFGFGTFCLGVMWIFIKKRKVHWEEIR